MLLFKYRDSAHSCKGILYKIIVINISYNVNNHFPKDKYYLILCSFLCLYVQ